MFQPLKKQSFNDFGLKLLQSYIATWAEQFNSIPFLSGRLVEDVEITTSGVLIEHKLGRTPRGWIVVKKNADARVWETASTSSTISLDTSATVTISLWIF